jgi:hypothetical protein
MKNWSKFGAIRSKYLFFEILSYACDSQIEAAQLLFSSAHNLRVLLRSNISVLRNMILRNRISSDPFYHVTSPLELFSEHLKLRKDICITDPHKDNLLMVVLTKESIRELLPYHFQCLKYCQLKVTTPGIY